jgi:tetratricopeptide (TPR) repeat protein
VYRTKGDTVTARDAQGEMQQTLASAHWYQQSLAALQKAAALSLVQREALRDWETRQASSPQSALNTIESPIYDEMGQTWLRLGNPTAAVEAFRHARRANPTREAVLLRLGDALIAAGQPAEAARSYWQALFIATDRAAAQKALTAIYAENCPQLNISCPLMRRDICKAQAEMAQLLADAGLNESARQARERAVTEYGCQP